MIDAGEQFAARSAAYSSAASSAEPAGTIRWTSPSAAASSVVKVRPDSSSSVARLSPISRGSSQALPCRAGSPRRANAVVIRAPVTAMRTSHISVCISPIPAHAPLIAAIIGLPTSSG